MFLDRVEAKEAQANELKENIDNLKLRNDRQKQKVSKSPFVFCQLFLFFYGKSRN